RLSSVFDHFRSNLTAADLFTQGLTASALAAAERAFPVLDLVGVEDRAPLARPPALPNVPRADRGARASNASGLAISSTVLLIGVSVLRRRRRATMRTNRTIRTIRTILTGTAS